MSRRPGDLNNLFPTGTEFIILLLIVAPIYFVITYWTVILAIGLHAVLLVAIGYGVYVHDEWRENKNRKRAAIIKRAESQHARLMDGDDSALYGDYPPADL